MTFSFHDSGAIILCKSVAYHTQAVSDMVTISSCIGESMVYHNNDKSLIDFPGDYDIGSHHIKAIYAGKTMSYVIKDEKKTFALITHKDALRHPACETHIKERFVTSTKLADYLTQLEREGTIHVLHAQDEETK